MRLLTDNIWNILAVCGIACAVLNFVICVLVLARVRLTFSCEYMLTEYIMLVCVIFVMLKNAVSDRCIVILFAVLILLWVVMQLRLRIKKLSFIRVYGIHIKMHVRLSDYLNECAEYNHMDRTSMYIYGGDAKTPCDMIIFKGVSRVVRKSVLSDVDRFLKKYSVQSISREIFLLCLNAAVVIMMSGLIL